MNEPTCQCTGPICEHYPLGRPGGVVIIDTALPGSEYTVATPWREGRPVSTESISATNHFTLMVALQQLFDAYQPA